MAEFQDFMSPTGIRFLQGLIGEVTPEPELGSTNPFDFREQAEEEVSTSGFFDENLDLVRETLDTVKRQRREQKELVERQEEEDFGAFQNIQDRGFARALGRASGRFAGRGTATSGFRRGALDEFFEGKEDTLEGQERERRQAGETRELGFEQFIESKDLGFEADKLGIERARESEILRRQQQLAQQTGTRNEDLFRQSNLAAARSLGRQLRGGSDFSSFIPQKIAG